ncbi:MAG TPA: response regulator [Bacillota bacterium]|nr:response regulator [Bacillota bacterium]HOR85580.1 response regulator [Bacillota bacterium]HPL54708.1 response regulator [Bacillota bacterium]
MGKKIVIADDEPITMMYLSEMLKEYGYDVAGEAFDGFDAVEICRKYKPDLVLMDVKMPLLDGIKATKIIMNEELSDSVVLLTAYSENEFVEQAKEAGVMGYLVKPIDEKCLLPAIEVAISKGKEIKRIKDDAVKAKEDLESRKIIERAKGMLMKKFKITEEEAYNRIRKLSMDKRCSMMKIAGAIILSD